MLSCGAKNSRGTPATIVGWPVSSRDKQLRMPPHISAVMCNINRDVANQEIPRAWQYCRSACHWRKNWNCKNL